MNKEEPGPEPARPLADPGLHTLPATILTDPQALAATLTARTPSTVERYADLDCFVCGAPQGARCRSASGQPTLPHAERINLYTCLHRCELPFLGRAPDYSAVTENGFAVFTLRHGTGEAGTRRDVVMVDCRSTEGYTHITLNVDLHRPGRAPHYGFLGDLDYPDAAARRGALYRAAVTAPDTALMQRMIGVLTSDLPAVLAGRVREATMAQKIFSVRSPALALEEQALFMEPDGRYKFAGVTEPYPGGWPHQPVVAAMEGDLSALWPYLDRADEPKAPR